jgi:hypothetical protein
MSIPDGASCASNEDSSLQTAQWWTERGFFVVPVPIGTKAPVENDWQHLRLRADQLLAHFSTPVNIGVLTGTVVPGDRGGHVCDTDFDCTEAVMAWSEFSPGPTWEFGRYSKPQSHAFYLVDSALASKRFIDPVLAERARQAAKKKASDKAKRRGESRNHEATPRPDVDALAGDRRAGDAHEAKEDEAGHKATLLELRCLKKDGTVGLQTVVPGSMHPSGEMIRWESGRGPDPTRVKTEDLVRAGERTAAAVLLARYWPAEGSRNVAFLALAGMLARTGWTQEDAAALARAIYRVLWPESPDFRAAESEVDATFKKFAAGGDVTGFRRLKELGVPKKVLDKCSEWLHVGRDASANVAAVGGGASGGRYFERDGKLYRYGPIKDDIPVVILLTSFTARIVENVVLDDGLEEKLMFRIRADAGGHVREFVLSAAQFEKPEWPMENLGSDAFCYPREWEHAKAAIRSLSIGAPRVTVYTHLGWHVVEAERIYLHGPGAIGPHGVVEGIETQLPPALARYELRLPRDPAETRAAIVASLRTLTMAGSQIMYPLLAFVYRSVLGPVAFVIFLLGSSGTFKSSIASVMQQHFGPRMGWDIAGFHLPLGFESTANAAEVVAFQVKDSLLTIDDFAPSADPHEASRTHSVAARLIRSVGNNAARQRLTRDGSLQAGRPPRCALLITAEHPPREKSLMARLLIIEVERGQVERAALTASQHDGEIGLLAQAMGGFVQWLASQLAERIRSFDARARELRANIVGPHARTPGAVAELWAAFELFLQFASEMGAIDEQTRQEYAQKAEIAFRQLAASQGANQREADPALRFRDLVRAAVTARRAHICHLDNHGVPDIKCCPQRLGWRNTGAAEAPKWLPGGDAIGWIGSEGLFLNFEAAEAVAQKLATEARAPLPVGGITLKRLLLEAKLLAKCETKRDRLTVRLPRDPERTPVLHVIDNFLGGDEEEGNKSAEAQPERPGGLSPGTSTDPQGQESQTQVLDAACMSELESASPAEEPFSTAIDTMDSDARAEVDRFAEVFGARAAGVIPRSQATPVPVVPAGVAEPADGPRQPEPPASAVVDQTAVETTEDRRAWHQRQRKIQHGWLVLQRFMRKNRRAALALRAQYPNDETALLLRLAERGMRGA